MPGDIAPLQAPDGRVSVADIVAAALLRSPGSGTPSARAAVDVAPGWISQPGAAPQPWVGYSDGSISDGDLHVLAQVVLGRLVIDHLGSEPFSDRFAALQDVREAIGSSPDALAAGARRVVQSGDPAAILAFVRDGIAPMPATASGFGDVVRGTRFGTRSALRSGIATLREKADLLAQLYNEAGLSATVVEGPIAGDASAARAEILRAFPLPFAPTIDAARLEAWRVALQAVPIPLPGHGDADGAASAALGDAILDHVDPLDLDVAPFDWSTLDRWPLVQVMIDGVPTWANPHVQAALLGESWTSTPPVAAPAALATPLVEITAWGATTASLPIEKLELVKGQWALADVAGRQVVLTFAATPPLAKAITTRAGDLRTFIPSLVVQGSDVAEDELADLMRSGDVLTVAGERIRSAAGGTITVDGRVVESAPASAEVIASVDSMSGEIATGTFPEVEVRFRAEDASGEAVGGLTASALTVEEDGQPRPFTLVSSIPPTPRVLFLFDVSSSIPVEFRGASAAAMARSIAESLASTVPGCEFRAAGVGSSGAIAHGGWTADPVALEANALAVTGSGSALWNALASAGSLGPTAVVFVTDGQATDTATAQRLGLIASGAPCILVGTGTLDTAKLDELANASHGAWFAATDAALAAVEVEARVVALTRLTYVLRYTAANPGPASRSVHVGLVGSVAGLTLPLDVPAQPLPPRRWVTLGLTIKVGTQSVTRILAGEAVSSADDWVPSPTLLDDVQLAFQSVHVISIEGGAPTTAALMDEALAGMLAVRPLHDTQEGSLAERLQVLDHGWFAPPMRALVAQPALPGHREGGVLTFETSPRVTIQSQVPSLNHVTRAVDVLPFTRFATALEDPTEAARTTLRRSARLAVAEAGVLPTSTLGLLGDEPLTTIRPGRLPPFSGALQAQWLGLTRPYGSNVNVIPTDGVPAAFWTVDPHSGTVLGILSDDSGGAREDAAALIDLIKRLYAMLSFIGDRIGMSSGFGGFLIVQQTQYTILLECTVAVSTLGTNEEPDLAGVDDAINGFYCDAVKEAIYASNLLGLVGKGLEAIDDILQVLTGDGLSCPGS
jgi:hypothetical protein